MALKRSRTSGKRPRVAAIGLSESQLAEIRPHCGDLRPAQSVSAYLSRFSWTETDIVVADGLNQTEIDAGVNVLTIGPMSFGLRQRKGKHPAEPFRERVRMDVQNRDRGVVGRVRMPANVQRSGGAAGQTAARVG